MKKLKLFSLALMALFSIGNAWGTLTAHQPGTYEKATDKGGYGATLVTVSSRQYEVYGFSYNSSGSKPQILWAGTSTNNASASQVLCSTLSTTPQEIAGWISMSTLGKSSTYSMPSSTEFAASSVGSTGLYQMKMQGHTMTLKISGYDQFSFLGNDNNADKSKEKYMSITINGNDSTKDVSTSTTVRRWSLDPSVEYTIVITGLGGSNEHIDAFSLRIPSCESVTKEPTLEAESDNLTITNLVSEPSTSLTFTKGDNQSNPTYEVTKGDEATTDASVEIVESVPTFSATAAGTYKVTATQKADGTYCEVIKEITITVTASIPVTACLISGETEAYKGDAVSFTADAPNATSYKWYVNNVEQASTTAALNYTTSAVGTDSIICKARNEYNSEGEWIADTLVLTITKVCGTLISAKTSGTVDGVVGGTIASGSLSGSTVKLNKNTYFGITLSAGKTFQAGDVFHMHITTAAGSAASMGTMKIYADKSGSERLYESENVGVVGNNEWTLPAAVHGKTSLYVYRGGGDDWNPTFDSIAVTRACEESSDATISSLSVNSDAVTEDDGTFSYTLSSSYAEETVSVAFTLNHPLATANQESPFTIATPATGNTNSQTIQVTAEDGTKKTYTVYVTKSASLNDDATLSALTVDGYTLDPVFASNTTAYTITKAYSASMPVVGDVTATPNDANAKGAAVELNDNVFTITVTAEDNTTTKEYTITVNTADARKNLLRATFSNGAIGYISGNNINVPYLAGETAPTFTSTTFWNAEGEPTAEVVDGNLVVTGIDSKTATYTITYVPVTPMELSYDEVTFTAVPSYIHSVYAWDADKGVKFAKDVEESSNHRISEGKDRIYIALPAAGKVIITSGNQGARPVIITVNGAATSITNLAAKNEAIEVRLSKSNANLVGIESNGSNGDGGIIKLQLGADYPTALDNTVEETKAVKFIENGQVVIFKDGKYFNVLGIQIR